MACNHRNPKPATVFSHKNMELNVYGDDVEVDYRGYEVRRCFVFLALSVCECSVESLWVKFTSKYAFISLPSSLLCRYSYLLK